MNDKALATSLFLLDLPIKIKLLKFFDLEVKALRAFYYFQIESLLKVETQLKIDGVFNKRFFAYQSLLSKIIHSAEFSDYCELRMIIDSQFTWTKAALYYSLPKLLPIQLFEFVFDSLPRIKKEEIFCQLVKLNGLVENLKSNIEKMGENNKEKNPIYGNYLTAYLLIIANKFQERWNNKKLTLSNLYTVLNIIQYNFLLSATTSKIIGILNNQYWSDSSDDK